MEEASGLSRAARLAGLVALASLFLPIGVSAADTPGDGPALPSLTVRVDQVGPKISPMLYGAFFEEINCAGDGGIYAELVRNRSFEDSSRPQHWSPVTRGACKGDISVDTSQPMSQSMANRRSLRLRITEAGGGLFGAANEGYAGIAAAAGEAYNLSLYARAGDGFAGPLTVSLESANGEVYARASITGLTDKWRQFKTTLTPKATDPKAVLVIGAKQKGTVWLDMVSLFPKSTWKNRPNGLRPDLASTLADLKPAFLRFPGGCWVEGDSLSSALRWKTTIGDISERRTQADLWGYMSTNGLGFHEYLQMCEDLGTEPVFIINCGMSHTNVVPANEMQPWVQDALDAIEYANGPTISRWGALRARNGHAGPFELKYIGIGNESAGASYDERYALFHDAIKEKYPYVSLIATAPTETRKAEIVDEHYYSDPGFFLRKANKYDSYDRRGPKVYVGEYAVTRSCGRGNVRAAVSEAAFLTGMERNSDVVVMASYAPLFANVNFMRWNPDLINFDNSRVYATPSYYVQKMFGENRGDVVLPVDIQLPPPGPAGTKCGGVGLGTWETSAAYKDVVVKQGDKVLYQSDFTKGSDEWNKSRGRWMVVGDSLLQIDMGKDILATTGDSSWTDYTLSLKARKQSGREGFLIAFHVKDYNTWAWWNLGGWGNSMHAIEYSVEGCRGTIGKEVRGSIEAGRWYDIRVEVSGRHVRCYLDGKLMHEGDYPVDDIPRLFATASKVESTGEVIVKVVNASSTSKTVQLRIEGVNSVGAGGKAVVLTSASPDDENSLDQPTRVVPVTQALESIGPDFSRSFPAYSVTVLRLPVN